MKIRKRKASEWTLEESEKRGGYVEFFENGAFATTIKCSYMRPEEKSTFLYIDEVAHLFRDSLFEPLPEIEVGDWIKTKYTDMWLLVHDIVDGIFHTYRYGYGGCVKQEDVTEVFKTAKPEGVK